MEKLNSGAKWFFRARAYWILLIILFVPGNLFLGILENMGFGFFNSITYIIITSLIVMIIMGEIYAGLSYSNWSYELTKDEIKIEKGIIFKNYKSIPYSRIQNIDIHRGIFARIFDFSTLEIQTAGYSISPGYGRARAEGQIPAVSVEDAEKIRRIIMNRIKGKKSGI